MDITRCEVMTEDAVIWIVKIPKQEYHLNVDAHALATTLDQLRVHLSKGEKVRGPNGIQ